MSVCYSQGWGDLIVPEAFAHPAKMARGLLGKILDTCLERGFLTPGSLVADPFGGVGTTGLLAAYRGLRAVSVELEPRFVDLAQRNYDLHRRELEILGCPLPVIVRGDSRNFASIISEAAGIVTSPPFSVPGSQPPMVKGSGADNCRKNWREDRPDGLGTTPGQLGAMPPGDVAAVLTSPPWEGIAQDHDSRENYDTLDAAMHRDGKAHGCKMGASVGQSYGTTEGQVGRESGDTYWAAVRDIYAQCLLALRPGGWLVCVVKGYVSKGKLVDLPAQTAALLTHLGFDLRILARAWLVERKEHAGLFGEAIVEEKSRESFFRRLAVKKGSPRIPFETVLFARKPEGGQGGGIDAAVTSPPYAASFNGNQSSPEDLEASMRARGCTQEAIAKACTPGSHTAGLGYGASPGQLGSLPAGSLDDVLKEDAP